MNDYLYSVLLGISLGLLAIMSMILYQNHKMKK